MKLFRALAAVAILLTLAPHASALDILVCNDDGFTSAHSPTSEGDVIAAGAVAVSVIAGVPEADHLDDIKDLLRNLSECGTGPRPGRHGRSHGCAW